MGHRTASALTLALALAGAGCYQPRALDARALLRQLDDPVPRGAEAVVPAAGASVDAATAVAIALANNPALRAARKARAVAEAEISAASALANPEVKLTAVHVQAVQRSRLGGDIELRWQPPQPVALSARRGAAEAGEVAAAAELQELEWDVATEVRVTLAALAEMDEEAALLHEASAERGKIVEAVRAKMAQGAATRFELDVAMLALAQAERDADLLESSRSGTRVHLASLLAIPIAGLRFAPPAMPGLEALPPAAAELEERALASRAALAAAKARYDRSEQQLRLEETRRWPWIELSAIPRLQANVSREYPLDVEVGVAVSLPLPWQTGAVRAAEAAREQEREKLTGVLLGVRTDIAGALADIEVRRRSLQRDQVEVVPALEEHRRLAEAALEHGELDLTALFLADELALRGRREHAAMRLAWRRAWFALDRAVGDAVSARVPKWPG